VGRVAAGGGGGVGVDVDAGSSHDGITGLVDKGFGAARTGGAIGAGDVYVYICI
jgi:carbamate kinase